MGNLLLIIHYVAASSLGAAEQTWQDISDTLKIYKIYKNTYTTALVDDRQLNICS